MARREHHRVDAQIHVEVDHVSGRILLDGADVSHLVRAITVVARVGEEPRATIDLITEVLDTKFTAARAELAQDCAGILIGLGWTPPVLDPEPNALHREHP